MTLPSLVPSRRSALPRWSWVIPCLAFVLYLGTFVTARSMGTEDLIGDADSAQYTGLLTQWDLSRRFGDAFLPTGRQLGDRQQSHKIKHVLFFQLFGPPVRWATAGGVDPWLAAKVPAALLATLIIVLVGLLLERGGAGRPVVFPAVAMLAVAPGMWVYAAQPDSWVLTGAFVMALLLWCEAQPAAVRWQGVAIGIAMLNNVLIGSVCIAILVLRLCRGSSFSRSLRAAVEAGCIALGTWLCALGLLSTADPDLAPHRVVAQLRFASQLVPPEPHPLWHPATLRLSIEQWTLTAFTSYQHDPLLVGWGLGNTWRTSVFGRLAIGVMAGTWLWAIGALNRDFRQQPSGFWHRHALLLAVAAVTLSFQVLLHLGTPRGMFLYAPLMAPLATLIIGLSLGQASKGGAALWGVSLVVGISGWLQVAWLSAFLAGSTGA